MHTIMYCRIALHNMVVNEERLPNQPNELSGDDIHVRGDIESYFFKRERIILLDFVWNNTSYMRNKHFPRLNLQTNEKATINIQTGYKQNKTA